MKPLSPYYYEPMMAAKHLWFHTARYDRFVSTPQIESYAARIGANLQEWPRGHINATCRTDIATAIGRQIRDKYS